MIEEEGEARRKKPQSFMGSKTKEDSKVNLSNKTTCNAFVTLEYSSKKTTSNSKVIQNYPSQTTMYLHSKRLLTLGFPGE